ncbi:MAG: hypothetical protein H6732_11750 [Alphaproteobacteria bacterium]|nr:hypothetical protein [Alphaproteobacteria bacterium]
MSWTGLDLRRRVRRRLARLLEGIADVVDVVDAVDDPPPAAPPPEPVVAPPVATPAPDPAPAPPPPLPRIDPRKTGPLQDAPKAPSKAATPAPATATPAAEKAKLSPEERQAAHLARTRKGLLRFVHDQGGRAGLRELHDYSEKTFFVAHVGFSRMMEELTEHGLLDYDHDDAVATLTDAGRAELD